MENKCYRVDYAELTHNGHNWTPDSDFIWCKDDKTAINDAMEYAKQGVDYADAGHFELEVVQIVEVDDTKECYPDKRVIWY